MSPGGRIIRSCGLVALVLSLAAALPADTRAATRVVRPDGSGDHPTIQAAVDASAPGDVILLEDGVYTGDGNRDLDCGINGITIRSRSGDPAACVIDCAGGQWDTPHRGFVFAAGSGARIEGLTVTNGQALGDALPVGAGGAVLCTGGTPRFANCVFVGNQAEFGGAFAALDAKPVLVDCRFRGNTAEQGGAVFGRGSSPRLVGCSFDNNAGFDGGAVACRGSSVELDSCRFVSNLGYTGGALSGREGADFRITDGWFQANFATIGGAVYLAGSTIELKRCTLVINTAGSGGCILGSQGSVVRLGHSIIAFSQQGGAMDLDGDSRPEVRCSLLYGNAEGDWTGALAALRGQDGNLWQDPRFTAPGQGDFSLAPDSPCRHGRPGCGPMITD